MTQNNVYSKGWVYGERTARAKALFSLDGRACRLKREQNYFLSVSRARKTRFCTLSARAVPPFLYLFLVVERLSTSFYLIYFIRSKNRENTERTIYAWALKTERTEREQARLLINNKNFIFKLNVLFVLYIRDRFVGNVRYEC
jgi:hypothetical protein